MKIVKIEEAKIQNFWETWWISIKFSGKNWTYGDIKWLKSKALHAL